MTRLPFVKLHGCANDYVLVDGFGEGYGSAGLTAPGDREAFARAVCDRRTSVGADGLLLALPPSVAGAHGRMVMLNPDGSEAEMCGNGLRCLGKFLFDRRRVAREFTVETRGGLVAMSVDEVDSSGRATRLTAALGVPDFDRANVPMSGPMTGPSTPALDEPFELANRALRVSALRLGNPHCVVFVDDVERFPVHSVGPALERDPRFPQRVNVEFVQVAGPDLLLLRTWERGAGETLACGSGAAAAAIVARKVYGFPPDVRLKLRGGELAVRWAGDGWPALLSGPAVEAFAGELDRAALYSRAVYREA
ncbi:MAG: diaminopimelate epimerase [Planctomycetes bacterium]|nr:diaminopimelate epimerase [Planctomycetota bacterium]